eukprot:3314802-Rhodomonas_salina.1
MCIRDSLYYARTDTSLLSLNDACKYKKIGSQPALSPACSRHDFCLLTSRYTRDQGAADAVGVPPIQQPMRYGNKAFRDWFDKAEAGMHTLV